MQIGKRTSNILRENREEILQTWISRQKKDPRIRDNEPIVKSLSFNAMEFINMLINLIAELEVQCEKYEAMCLSSTKVEHFIQSILSEDISLSPKLSAVIDILNQMSERRERSGFKPFEIASAINIFKECLIPYINRYYKDSPETFLNEMTSISRLTDTLALITSQTIVNRREAIIRQQTQDILELSTPTIQMWDKILIAPLIGMLDSQRGEQLMEKLLTKLVETRSLIAIIDVTGVVTIDTKTAQNFIDTINAMKLIGSQAIITGISPSIAQTMIHLGITLENFRTKATLSAGLAEAFDLLNLKVVNKNES